MLIVKREQAKLYISIKLFMNVLSKLNRKKFTEINTFCLKAITLAKLLPRQTANNGKNFAWEKALAIAECWGEFCSLFSMQNMTKKKN